METSNAGSAPLATPFSGLALELCSAYSSGYTSTATEANISTLLPGVNYLGIGLQWAPGASIVCIGNLATAGLTSLQELEFNAPSASARCVQANQACIATEASMYADVEHALALGSGVVLAVPLYSTQPLGESMVVGALLVGYISMDTLTSGQSVQTVAQLAAAMTPHLPTLLDDFLPSILRGLSTAHTSSGSNSTVPRVPSTSKSTSPEQFPHLSMTSWHSSHASSFRSMEGAVSPSPHELGMALLRGQWGAHARDEDEDENTVLGSRDIESLTDASWKIPPPLSRAQSAPDSQRGDDEHQHARPVAEKRSSSAALERTAGTPLTTAAAAAATTRQGDAAAPQDTRGPSQEQLAASRSNKWLDARTRLLEEMRSSSTVSQAALDNTQTSTGGMDAPPRRRLGQWLSFLRTPSSKSTARASRSSTDTAGVAASEAGEEVPSTTEPVRRAALGSFSFGFGGVLPSGEDSASEVMEASFSIHVRSPRRGKGSSGGSTPKDLRGSLDIRAVAEGREHTAASADDAPAVEAAKPPASVVQQHDIVSPPPASWGPAAMWCACGAATLVALGMFAGRPAMQVAAVVVGGTVAACCVHPLLRHPSLVAASLALAVFAISFSIPSS